ncbi:adenosylcobinamide-GDP ribazoletransferase [Roseibium denhamense]
MNGLIADTAACIRFFSRIPLASVSRHDDPAALPDFTRTARAAPLAGWIIALPAAALGMVLALTALPPLAAATLVAACLAVITGALHEDGLSDVADGFFGAMNKTRRLEIMKDSRIGAFGALALILSVALRIALLAALWERFGPADAAVIFLCGEALSRALLVWQWQSQPLARPDGLAARFGKPGAAARNTAFALVLLTFLPVFAAAGLANLIAGVVLAAAAAAGAGKIALYKIGGTTGDVLGAIQQISSLAFLAGILVVP